MIYFECDYQEGCAPEILERLMATNKEQSLGYGEDAYTQRAKHLIHQACGREEAQVHFLVGGTQTNATVIRSILRPHQGVLCALTGHINVHESGAIEASGHKVLALPTTDGLLSAEQVRDALYAHHHDPNYEHMVQPAMVYISYPSEVGTLYSREQLSALRQVCDEYHIPLYIDGARLGYGLMSAHSDVSLRDIARLSDVFYIGGTKQGALFGEALVIGNPYYQQDFRYLIKQGGGLLAKGRLLGLQFETLFTDDLYWRLARHADQQASRIREALLDKGYTLYMDSPTNQLFVVFTDEQLRRLERDFVFAWWEKVDADHTAVRICTSWATTEDNVNKLIDSL